MTELKVQQFVAGDDDFFEQGDPRLLDLTDAELAALIEDAGEPIRLERRSGFFLLVDDDQPGAAARKR